MTEDEVTQAFESYAKGKGIDVDDLSLSDFPRHLIGYYRDVEFAEVDRVDDGDLLLFQYGTYDWGCGAFFEVDFTRQFYRFFADAEDHEIIQQSFTFYFGPTNFQQIESFSLWSNAVASIDQFEAIIINSDGYLKGLQQMPERFELSIADVC